MILLTSQGQTAHNNSIENAQGIFKGKGKKLPRVELGTLLQKTIPSKLKIAACRTDYHSANLRNVYRPAEELDNADLAFQVLAHEGGFGFIESAQLSGLPSFMKKVQRLPLDYEDEDEDSVSEFAAFYFSARLRKSSVAYHVTDAAVARNPRVLYACVYTMVVRWLYDDRTRAVRWLYNGCTMIVQWLYNGCTMVVQWLYNGCTMVDSACNVLVRWLYDGCTCN
jgi:hypothetical protein